MTDFAFPTESELRSARDRISPFVHRTLVLHSMLINNIAGADLFFKCENFQKIGAFKFRGATNAILQLSDEEKANGVATHSSGNHAQALALAAKQNGAKAYIVMPKNAPKVKSNAVKDYGAQIIWCEPTLKAREETLKQVVLETGASVIHPFDNHNVICGQSTVVQELLEQIHDLEAIITPVGGGGLLSGSTLARKYFSPNIKVYGAEPEGAADAFQSFKSGKFVPMLKPDTIADGLRTSLSHRTLAIISDSVDDIFLVKDSEILKAMHLIWERMKIIVEPSSAITLAVVLRYKDIFAHKKVGLVLSGGNVDLNSIKFN